MTDFYGVVARLAHGRRHIDDPTVSV